jgi:hypothetical protein
VHMADTLLGIEGMPLGNAVYVQTRSDLYRWTSVSVDTTGCVRITNDREAIEPCGPKPVCVGLFSFEDGECLAAELSRAVEQRSPGREPFFVALEGYSSTRPMSLRPTQRWMDCGHVDGYYESRLSYQSPPLQFLELRRRARAGHEEIHERRGLPQAGPLVQADS